jgi:Dyp-type peroxidase family
MPSGPQFGILNRPPEHELLLALRFEGDRNRAASTAALEALRGVLTRELHSDVDTIDPATTYKSVAFPETGELGFSDGFNRNHLTVTVGLSPTALDALEVPSEQRPADLVAVPWDDPPGLPRPAQPATGDVLLQICSDSNYVNEHVQRRVEHSIGQQLQTVWCITGSQRFTSRSGRVNVDEARALNGFLDGTANLDPAHNDDDYDLVFIDPDKVATYPASPPEGTAQPGQPGYGTPKPPVFPKLRDRPPAEPAWTRDGTYQFLHAIVLDTPSWDTRSLSDQERTIGRFKLSGSSLDLTDDPARRHDEPAFAQDPQTEGAVPFLSHIRKVNPRSSPEDRLRRIFRRGYPLMLADGTGVMRRGLIFQSFSRSTSTQIEFILRAWMFNPDFPQQGLGTDLLAAFFTNTLVGGYYFIPPLQHRHDPVSWAIPPA